MTVVAGPVIRVRQPGRNVLHLVVVEPIEVGRDCIGLLLDDDRVSRRHVELQPEGDGLQVRDLGSTNGTTIDGQALSGPAILMLGQTLCIGDTTLEIIESRSGSVSPSSEPVDAHAFTSIDKVADAFVRDGINLAPEEGRTRTIVFSDIEGSTELAVEMGDVQWYELLDAHNSLIRSVLARHRGTEVKSQGDGFMLTFTSARSAVAFMVEAQRSLHGGGLGRQGLRIRIGAHTGEALETVDGDLFGRAVIMAARVGAAAMGGEVLVSSLVREIVESWGDIVFGPERLVELKGLGGRHALHPVAWDEDSPTGG